MKTELRIDGMQCEACVSHVTKALRAVAGVKDVAVTLQPGRAVIEHEGSVEPLVAAVREEGYEAQPA